MTISFPLPLLLLTLQFRFSTEMKTDIEWAEDVWVGSNSPTNWYKGKHLTHVRKGFAIINLTT